jgi:hypothetical protein
VVMWFLLGVMVAQPRRGWAYGRGGSCPRTCAVARRAGMVRQGWARSAWAHDASQTLRAWARAAWRSSRHAQTAAHAFVIATRGVPTDNPCAGASLDNLSWPASQASSWHPLTCPHMLDTRSSAPRRRPSAQRGPHAANALPCWRSSSPGLACCSPARSSSRSTRCAWVGGLIVERKDLLAAFFGLASLLPGSPGRERPGSSPRHSCSTPAADVERCS